MSKNFPDLIRFLDALYPGFKIEMDCTNGHETIHTADKMPARVICSTSGCNLHWKEKGGHGMKSFRCHTKHFRAATGGRDTHVVIRLKTQGLSEEVEQEHFQAFYRDKLLTRAYHNGYRENDSPVFHTHLGFTGHAISFGATYDINSQMLSKLGESTKSESDAVELWQSIAAEYMKHYNERS